MLCSCLEASLLSAPRCPPLLLSLSFLDKRTEIIYLDRYMISAERSQTFFFFTDTRRLFS